MTTKWHCTRVFCLVAAMLLGACDRLPFGQHPAVSTQRPDAAQLGQIHYMSRASGTQGADLFDHLEQARSCGDLELAMRWNRPPDLESGPFHKKLVYLTGAVPADLPRQSEVFLVGTIERGDSLPSGSWGWIVRMSDGSKLQAIEGADYWQRQEQEQEEEKPAAGATPSSGQPPAPRKARRRTTPTEGGAAIVSPNVPGRKLCARGVYQGAMGRAPDQPGNIPLVSVLFAMDRAK